uniref:Alpha/beta hydrolase fold-3 domain-containing protein n=1 Tax=Manihot esculenta TaxID=3983 RepID=A0A2C9WA16_MANES
MASSASEITHDFPPFFKVYKDDPETEVQSRDVVSIETGVRARIFIPKLQDPDQQLPLFVQYHGGGFCIGSSFDVVPKTFLTFLSILLTASHLNGLGPEPWLNKHVDFGRLAVQAGAIGLGGLKIIGVLIVHPFFAGKEEDKMYKKLCPTSSGCDDDLKLNPAVDPNLSKLGCKKVLNYYRILGNSGWCGKVKFYETKGEEHCFHLFKTSSERDMLITKFVHFMTQE